jgi:hypothetical protein
MNNAPIVQTPTVTEQPTATAVAADDGAMFTGKIEGGWGYVGMAYGISLAILLIYVLVVSVRLRGLEARDGSS